MAAEPIHIRPTAALAERALLPGDPGRALMLAQSLLEEPRMFNHNRGLWGYTGTAADGLALTIQSTGMGGPSIAIVVTELIGLGLRRAIRVGTAGGLDDGLALGDVVVAREAIAEDGAGRALAGTARTFADGGLADAMLAAEPRARAGAIVSTDLFYDAGEDRGDAWREAGAIAVEMEAATLFALAARHGIAAGCVLAISDLLADGRRIRIGEEQLAQAGEHVGQIAAAALATASA